MVPRKRELKSPYGGLVTTQCTDCVGRREGLRLPS
jgi:hypothetical protein